jgi:amino acid transporter
MVLNDASYVFERWHGTMLVIAVVVFSLIFNTFLAKKLPMVESIMLVIYIIGFFAIIIPLWVLAPRANAHDVFTQFTNAGGWSSTGTAFMVGLSGVLVSICGFDCAAHMGRWRVLPVFKLIQGTVLIKIQRRRSKTPQKPYLGPSWQASP